MCIQYLSLDLDISLRYLYCSVDRGITVNSNGFIRILLDSVCIRICVHVSGHQLYLLMM